MQGRSRSLSCARPAGSSTRSARRSLRRLSSLGTLAVSCAWFSIAGAEPDPDRAGSYHLFRPRPSDRMREMSTDRPDRTESAYTLDAGHFQLEMDATAWTQSHADGEQADQWSAGTINLKAGLTDRTDFQLVVESWSSLRTRLDGGSTETRSGFGDLTARLKVNLFGNDGGKVALALMPFAAFPTSQNELGREDPEIGLIAPVAVGLPGGFGLGAMAEVDVTPALPGSALWIVSATTSHDLFGPLGGYIELYGAWPADHSATLATFDAGLTWGLRSNVQVDTGVNLGLTQATEDATVFLGLSVRH
jgi:hypothetical protein